MKNTESKLLTGVPATKKYSVPNAMTNVTTRGTKVFQSTLKQASSTVITAAFRVALPKKNRGNRISRGTTQPRYEDRNPFTRNPLHVRILLQSRAKPLNGSEGVVSVKRP